MRYLGQMLLSDTEASNNLTCSSPFNIPQGVPAILLYTTASVITFEVDAPPTAGSLTATANSYPLPQSTPMRVATKGASAPTVVACLATGGPGTVQVYADF